MPLANLKNMLSDARRGKYCIPCLLGGNMEMIIGEIKAAEEKRSPVIISFNEALTPEVPMELGILMLVKSAEKANVPVAVILDHGRSFETIIKAMHYGCSAVMFDGSRLPYEENVRMTKELVKAAHTLEISLEAELGSPGGNAEELGDIGKGESCFTDPEQVVDFTERTEVDALAISFGNVHGIYKGEPKLDLERVRKIYSMTDIPLVMHGGSGLSDDDYKNIIESGISKINYVTVMALNAVRRLKNKIDENPQKTKYNSLISEGINIFYDETKKLLDLFGCSGKAV